MLQQNDRRSVMTGLRVNSEDCEIFKPRDRVYWCSDRCCNECGIVETRVGTSNGDPSTDSYQVKRISDGAKIEIPGYILRRSAKYHPYHTRNRSSASTCSVHGPGHAKKVPQERKRRRHASGHPNPPDATIAKSLGNDGGFAKNNFSHKLLSPPEDQEFGLLGIEIKPQSNACAPENCIMRRSNSGLPPVIQGWLSGTIPPPDADNEDTAPLSTSPSADEGVDLSDAMFSFDDDMIFSPPGCPITHNPNIAGGTAGCFHPLLSMSGGGGGVGCCNSITTNASNTNKNNSDEDTPRTPVAVPTYQLSNDSSSGAISSSRNLRGVNLTIAVGASANESYRGSYFTRSQANQQKSQVCGCSCVHSAFSFSSNDNEGNTEVSEHCEDRRRLYVAGDKSENCGLLQVGSRSEHGDYGMTSTTNNCLNLNDPKLLLNKDYILENCAAVSDEGIVDYDVNGAMPRTPSSCRDMLGLLSPDSTSGGVADLSGDLSDDDLDQGPRRYECSLEETISPTNPIPPPSSRVLRSRNAAVVGGGAKISSGYEGAASDDDVTAAVKLIIHKGVGKSTRKQPTGGATEVLSCPVSRRQSGRSRISRASEPTLCTSYSNLLLSVRPQVVPPSVDLSLTQWRVNGSCISTSSSVDQVTNGLARMKTKVSPCNTTGNGAMYRSDVTDGDADLSDNQSGSGSSNSSEGETPSAKKTRLQQRLLKQEQMMQRKTRSAGAPSF